MRIVINDIKLKPFLVALSVVFFIQNGVFSQEDSLRNQAIQEVTVSVKKQEIVFSKFDGFVMNFDFCQGDFYILSREIFDHHMLRLNDRLEPIDTMSFSFHPLDIFESCQNQLIVLSKDSMFTIGIVDHKMQIIERNSKRIYFSVYKDCVGSVSDLLYMKTIKDLGNTTVYHSIDLNTKKRNGIYVIIDSLMFRTDREEIVKIKGSEDADRQQSKELNPSDLASVRSKQDHAAFFKNIKSAVSNHPLFVYNDTLYIFDHLHRLLVQLDPEGNILSTSKLSDTLSDLWNDKVYMDKYSGKFYAVNVKNGVFTMLRVSRQGEIERSVEIEDHAFPRNLLVYKDYVYFTAKVNLDDNLNKLFRQRL